MMFKRKCKLCSKKITKMKNDFIKMIEANESSFARSALNMLKEGRFGNEDLIARDCPESH